MKRIRTHLAVLMALAGVSLREVADKAGVTVSAAGRWRDGERRPRPHHALILEALFGYPIDELLQPIEDERR